MARGSAKDVDVSRLLVAMQRCRLMLRYYRAERREMVRQLVGRHWSEEGTSERVPVNLISLYVSVVGRNLIAKNPRVMLSTFDRKMKPTVNAMQTWANREIERGRLQETLQRIVTDALFSVGIAKVALASPAESASVGWSLGSGQPFAERVDLDDFVYDMHARDFEHVSFIGHRYRVPLEVVKESRIYGKGRKDLVATWDQPYNLEGDERINVLGRGLYQGSLEEFEDHVDLWEVYLPRHRLVLTLADDYLTGPALSPGGRKPEALRVQNWLGPECGPYHVLGYGVVPGNAMPKGPIQDLIDLHEAVNRAYRKVIRTVDRIKEVTGVASGAMDDAARVLQADDGDMIQMNNPERVKQFVTAGSAIQHVLGVATVLKDLFAYMAGNLDMMGGLSPQSKTLGQDQMLAQNATRAVADMQDRTITFTADVLRAMCWYWWHDPFTVQRTKHNLPGIPDLQIQRRVTPQQRQAGRFEDLEIEVDPYSMQHQTPQSRMQAINGVVQQVVLPMMGLMVQQGVSFDINAYLQKVSQYMDMPDLADILTIREPPDQESQVGSPEPDKAPLPAQTRREYVRHNMPSSTREASDRNLASGLLGVNPGGAPESANGSFAR